MKEQDAEFIFVGGDLGKVEMAALGIPAEEKERDNEKKKGNRFFQHKKDPS